MADLDGSKFIDRQDRSPVIICLADWTSIHVRRAVLNSRNTEGKHASVKLNKTIHVIQIILECSNYRSISHFAQYNIDAFPTA